MAVITIAVCDEIRKDAQKLYRQLSTLLPDAEILIYRSRQSLLDGLTEGHKICNVVFMGLDGENGKSLETVRAIRLRGNYIPVIMVAENEKFYKEEMMYRMLLDYPPAAHMMTVFGACQDEELLKNAMYYIEVFIRRVSPKEELHMIGPASASVGKVKDVYRQVLHLKHTDIRFLTAVREKLEKYIEINSGFRKIYIQFDFS